MGKTADGGRETMKLLRWSVAALALALACASPAFGQATGVSPAQMFGCNRAATFSGATGMTQLLVSSSGSVAQIYVCGFDFTAGAASTATLEYGTQSTNPCDTGTTAITPALNVSATVPTVDHQPYYAGITPAPNGKQLCVAIGGTGPASGIVYYTQF
jgi:hypothetical protein